MADIRVIQVYDPVAIQKTWGFLVEGVEKVLHHSLDDITIDDVYNRLLSGRDGLYVAFVDNKYAGFYTITIEQRQYHQDMILLQGYLKPGTPKEVSDTCYWEIEQLARKLGCKNIRTYCYRPGMERYYAKRGWKKGYTEFYLPLEG